MKRFWLPLFYVILVVGASIASGFVADTSVFTPDIKLADPGKSTLDYLGEMIKLATSLNTAMFGAAAALAIKGREWSARWGALESGLVVAAFVAGAIAYYGIYLSQVTILEMVQVGAISLERSRLKVALAIQYYAVLVGVFLLGFLFVLLLGERTGPKPPGG
ncbi:hypothetical protein H8N03_01145 [Ramlibacter sp. USB13]|uniref:Uncharacterized protein n=1 Tax=Ramlibacter cellulosilyticus TaxID=2764187 RepID=A0A923S9S3_9BURK|nr:hypothetical protein [Ramlibacter cellulosilyticus]MBC5781528.1 hypothetical protein [Ramlibacter cellulosilyticus]